MVGVLQSDTGQKCLREHFGGPGVIQEIRVWKAPVDLNTVDTDYSVCYSKCVSDQQKKNKLNIPSPFSSVFGLHQLLG